ncbi:hypothetical protein ACQ4LE_006440 [Meloidogyne hapla]|uniref:C2H2-type domain-containing protein n=1 Tax=Meloidogyne hapla TaxID=6305 RepID=A0A1I8BSS7_MELHA
MFEMPLEQTSLSELVSTSGNTNKTTKTNGTNNTASKTNFVLESWNEHNNISSNGVSSDLVSSTTLMPSFSSSTAGGVGQSPLEQLIKLQERLNHDPYSTTSSSAKITASSSSLSHLKNSNNIIQQPTHSEENLDSTNLFDPLTTQQLGNLPSYSSPFILDPSSPSALMLSSYAAAASSWNWSGEMAALLCREGEGIINNASGFRGSWGGEGNGYLGNLGALVQPPQTSFSNTFFPTTTGERSSLSSQSYQSFPASSFADLKTLATTSRELQQNNHETNIQQSQQNRTSTSSTSIISQFDQHKMRSNKSGSQQHKNKAGGKMRTSANAKNNCECPNCKELQRTGAQIDEKHQKHSCHVPGCHKVYSRSSHLKAHLRWHSNDRPPTTKRRLFDPPEGPPPQPVPLNLNLKALSAKVQLEQMRGREH